MLEEKTMTFRNFGSSETSVSAFPSAFSSYKPRHQKVYGCICISNKGRILLVKGKLSGKWSLPKGHMEANENDIACALRELYQETGICPDVQYSSYKKLCAGGYFIFFLNDEPTPNPLDVKEIEEATWMDIDEIRKLNCNVDLNRCGRWIKSALNNIEKGFLFNECAIYD